ncbi:MAG: hypothetical protein V8S98_10605 [Lachnospiraceae bacterium]
MKPRCNWWAGRLLLIVFLALWHVLDVRAGVLETGRSLSSTAGMAG